MDFPTRVGMAREGDQLLLKFHVNSWFHLILQGSPDHQILATCAIV